MGVEIKVGPIALTLNVDMGAKSIAIALVMPSMACLEAQ